MAGFISKWYLGVGAFEAGQSWAIAVLVASTVLNTAYFLPVVYVSLFGKPAEEWHEERPRTRFETDWLLLFPTLAVAALVLLVGLFAGWEFSPLGWADLVASREWGGQFGRLD